MSKVRLSADFHQLFNPSVARDLALLEISCSRVDKLRFVKYAGLHFEYQPCKACQDRVLVTFPFAPFLRTDQISISQFLEMLMRLAAATIDLLMPEYLFGNVLNSCSAFGISNFIKQSSVQLT